MIPKIIHYCWFGRTEKPKDVLEYIETWKQNLPDFEIREWNEDNFDINEYEYAKEAYYAKKYAFVSDVARLHALVNEGGIYLDTDIKFLKGLPDSLLEGKGFLSFENYRNIATAMMASEKHNPVFEEFFHLYKQIHFFRGLKFDLCPNVNRLTRILEKKGLRRDDSHQRIEGVEIFPQVFFSAKLYRTGEYYDTEDTYAIHDFKASWTNEKNNFVRKFLNIVFNAKIVISYKLKKRII